MTKKSWNLLLLLGILIFVVLVFVLFKPNTVSEQQGGYRDTGWFILSPDKEMVIGSPHEGPIRNNDELALIVLKDYIERYKAKQMSGPVPVYFEPEQCILGAEYSITAPIKLKTEVEVPGPEGRIGSFISAQNLNGYVSIIRNPYENFMTWAKSKYPAMTNMAIQTSRQIRDEYEQSRRPFECFTFAKTSAESDMNLVTGPDGQFLQVGPIHVVLKDNPTIGLVRSGDRVQIRALTDAPPDDSKWIVTTAKNAITPTPVTPVKPVTPPTVTPPKPAPPPPMKLQCRCNCRQ